MSVHGACYLASIWQVRVNRLNHPARAAFRVIFYVYDDFSEFGKVLDGLRLPAGSCRPTDPDGHSGCSESESNICLPLTSYLNCLSGQSSPPPPPACAVTSSPLGVTCPATLLTARVRLLSRPTARPEPPPSSADHWDPGRGPRAPSSSIRAVNCACPPTFRLSGSLG